MHEMRFYTDYHFKELGDAPYKIVPVRRIEILSYDGNKYCDVLCKGKIFNIKSGYIYPRPYRLSMRRKLWRKQRLAFDKWLKSSYGKIEESIFIKLYEKELK